MSVQDASTLASTAQATLLHLVDALDRALATDAGDTDLIDAYVATASAFSTRLATTSEELRAMLNAMVAA